MQPGSPLIQTKTHSNTHAQWWNPTYAPLGHNDTLFKFPEEKQKHSYSDSDLVIVNCLLSVGASSSPPKRNQKRILEK
jgi:hypothetical protein